MSILVVDDSRLMRAWTRVNLSQAGFDVQEVEPTSLFDILYLMRQNQPELLITDYEMPHCNGETLVKVVREDPILKNTPIVLISSHREAELVERLSQFKLCAYLIKPVSPETLVRVVQEHLRPKDLSHLGEKDHSPAVECEPNQDTMPEEAIDRDPKA